MSDGISPTLRVWQLAESLRIYRERAGLTIEEAGARLHDVPRWTRSKVQRVETRIYTPKWNELEPLAKIYDLTEGEHQELVLMAKEARKKGWWQSSAVPKGTQTLVGLEQSATAIRQFELALVPGLLQTSEYARALMTEIGQALPADELERRVAARMTRQHILKANQAPKYQAIIAEGVLRCRVGGARVMRGQLERLLEVSDEFGAVIQVLPFAAGSHEGLDGTFSILTLPQIATDVVHVEGMMGTVYLESQDDIRTCTMCWASLVTRALSQKKSADFIASIVAEYK